MSAVMKDTRGVELNLEGLLKLLGGTPDDRERFWERFKGITTPAEARLVDSSLVAVEHQLQNLHTNLASLHEAVGEIR
jgi:hypothetical protein